MKAQKIKFTAEKRESSAKKIFDACALLKNGDTLAFETGEYHIFSNDCARAKYYVTSSDNAIGDELSGITYLNKNLAVFLQDKENITIDGGGSLFVVHGEMTPIVIANSKNITIKNLSVDYLRPAVSEMKITEVSSKYFVVRVNADSPFSIVEDKICWMSDNMSERADTVEIYDPETEKLFKSPKRFTDYRAENLGDNFVKLYFPFEPPASSLFSRFKGEISPTEARRELRVGRVIVAKYDLRTQAGALVAESEYIRFDRVNMNFMQGPGLAVQCSKNISVTNSDFVPREDSGRVTAAFTDFLHFNGVGGKVTVKDCKFSGATESGILAHGTYMRVVKILNADTLVVEFTHARTLGFEIFKRWSRITFKNASTLKNIADGVVESAKLTDNNHMEITLFDRLPKGVRRGALCDNLSAHADIEILDCEFKNIAGDGIFACSDKSVTVSGNTFKNCGGAGVFLGGDGKNLYRSGLVGNAKISGNHFSGCGIKAGLDVKCKFLSARHKNIEITKNVFKSYGSFDIKTVRAENVIVGGNTFLGDTQKDKPVKKTRRV